MSSQTAPAFKSPYAAPGVSVDTRKLIHFATDGVQPPSAVYLDALDQLAVIWWSTDVQPILVVRYRFLNPAGEIIQGQEVFNYTVAPRAAQTNVIPLTEGFLLSLEISPRTLGPQILARGLTRVQARIFRGLVSNGLLNMTLCQGMVDQHAAVTWPGGFIDPTASGQGFTRSITGTTPAAGAEISETVPTGARFGLRTFRFTLTTSATVANRGVVLLIDDGANTLFAIEAAGTQAAGIANTYNYAANGLKVIPVFGSNHSIGIPVLTLGPGYRIRTATQNLQVGDQYTAPQYSVEDWFSN